MIDKQLLHRFLAAIPATVVEWLANLQDDELAEARKLVREWLDTILIVEYWDGRPFIVITNETEWDVDWCRSHEQLYHWDGNAHLGRDRTYCLRPGGTEVCEIYADPSITFIDGDGPVSEEDLADLGYVRVPYPATHPLADSIELDDSLIYCRVCDDHYPSPDHDDVVCDHILWCNAWSDWAGTGSDHRHEDYRESFMWLARAIGLRQVLKALEAVQAGGRLPNFSGHSVCTTSGTSWRFTGGYRETRRAAEVVAARIPAWRKPRGRELDGVGDYACDDPENDGSWETPGQIWLEAIGEDTPEELKLTIGWLKEELL